MKIGSSDNFFLSSSKNIRQGIESNNMVLVVGSGSLDKAFAAKLCFLARY